MRCRFIFISLMLSAVILSGCSTYSHKPELLVPDTYERMLHDPDIQKDFNKIKRTARKAEIYYVDGMPHITDIYLRRLNILSQVLIYRLRARYHLNARYHRVYTFIKRAQSDSCYEYYNSQDISAVGSECSPCVGDACIELHSRKNFVMSYSYHQRLGVAYISSFHLQNGELVYLALDILD